MDFGEIKYPRARKCPVRLKLKKIEDSEYHFLLVMEVFIHYAQNMLNEYRNSDGTVPDGLMDGYTFADAFEDGIRTCWGGSYHFDSDGQEIIVRTEINIVRYGDADFPTGQRYFKVGLSNWGKTSFVLSPLWRWLWGYLTGHRECATLNWSLQQPGRIFMIKYGSLYRFRQTCAHEFGHILGLGDAYPAFYRFYYEAPGTRGYMMNNNHAVSNEELSMVLKAHRSGKMQYFPCKFVLSNLKRFLRRK